MFKHTIKIIIPIILILIILIIGYNSYKEISGEKENPLSIIPSNTALILQLKNLDNIIENLQESNVTKLLMTINGLQNTENHLKKINNIFKENTNIFNSNNTVLVSFHKVGANNSAILYTTNFSLQNIKNNKQISSIIGNVIKKTEYDNQIIYNIEHENQEIYCSFKNDIFFFKLIYKIKKIFISRTPSFFNSYLYTKTLTSRFKA